MRYLFCIEAYIFFISFLQIIITNSYFYAFEDHYPYLHHFYLIMQNFPPEQKIPIWALTMMVGVVLLMGIYYKSKSIFLMQKNSYRFNFVQRSDIVIFCYCSICLPTCNSEMFHILCRCIRTHVPISNVLYSLQFYICTCLITQLFW